MQKKVSGHCAPIVATIMPSPLEKNDSDVSDAAIMYMMLDGTLCGVDLDDVWNKEHVRVRAATKSIGAFGCSAHAARYQTRRTRDVERTAVRRGRRSGRKVHVEILPFN